MAKLVITGDTRQQALVRARRALAEFSIEGVASVLPFHRAVLEEKSFTGEDGFKVHTNWIETEFSGVEPSGRVAPAEGGLLKSFIEIDGKRHTIGLPASLFANVGAPRVFDDSVKAEAGADIVTAPVPGTLQKWLVEEGAMVVEGDAIAIMEAMKMEMRVVAPKSGRIRIHGEAGSPVTSGEKIAIIE
jgi:acetyl-CoA/propionyl-CoA carboxylase biotin carboxyl carrier protein